MYDVIVVGAGVEGSATAYYLAKMGKKILLLEQFPLPHSRGSSHGSSRITRKAYDSDVYTKMMVEAYKMWDALEKETDKTLFKKTGCLTFEHNCTGAVKRTAASMRKYEIPHEFMSSKQISERWPNIQVPESWVGVLDPNAGVLMAEKCLQAYHSQFRRFGGILQDNVPMTDLQSKDGKIVVKTTKDIYESNSVVLCLGPWAKQILSKLGLELPLKPVFLTVCYWRSKNENEYSAENEFPCMITSTPNGHCYGIPSMEYPNLFKFCHNDGPEINPDSRDRSLDLSPNVEIPASFIGKYFKNLETRPSIVEKCTITWTPDASPILDTHPVFKNIVIGAGFSGHGFKLSPVVGKILSELATGQKLHDYDMNIFKINRFENVNWNMRPKL